MTDSYSLLNKGDRDSDSTLSKGDRESDSTLSNVGMCLTNKLR